MSNEMFKMGWFVDAYKNGNINYLLWDSGKKKGTVVLPTGAGKSGIIYANIVRHINEAPEGAKIVFNISAPILKLEAQLLNDYFEVAQVIFKDKIERGEFMFFINSSADGDSYDVGKIFADVQQFSEIGKFKESKTARFAIVASCHKSLYKFAEKIDELNEYATVITYLDEAHLVVNETRDDLSYDKLSEEGKKRFDVLRKLCSGSYIYGLTATPDKYVMEEINKEAGEEPNYKIVDVPARQLIAENKILPVKTFIREVSNGDEDKITPEVCASFMELVKKENPEIKHKVLVTCANTPHLEKLSAALGKKFKVFATCSKNGTSSTEGDEETPIDEVEFIKEVDAWDGDCFVLHIRQLIQGIDVKTLTDCIIYNSVRLNDGVKRTIIQTIGRVLRPMAGERGVDKEQRKKKNGNVLFLIGQDDFDGVKNQITGFLLKYYGRDGYESFTCDITQDHGDVGKVKTNLGNGNSHFGDGYPINTLDELIKTLMVDMEKYINEKVLPRYRAIVKVAARTGQKLNPSIAKNEILGMQNKYKYFFGDDDEETKFDTFELLSSVDFMKAVSDLFKKYGIE